MNFFTLLYTVMFFFGFFFLMLFIILHYRYKRQLLHSPTPTRFPTLSILVPAYNEEKSLEKTVTALLALDYPQDKLRIFVIDDGSKDTTRKIGERLAHQYDSVTFLHKSNSGKAHSLNYALAKVSGELTAVVDADSYPQPQSVRNMIGHFQDKNVTAVTSRVLVKNKNGLLCKFQVLDYAIIAWTRKLLDFVNSVYVTNGPLSIYRTSTLKKIGGFDPHNLTEDIEVTWHMLAQGYQTRMSYNAIVYTTVPTKLSIWIKQRVRWNLGGMQTVQKYYRSMFSHPEHVFGYFVVPYVSASFALALLGFLLMVRYLWIKGSYHLLSWYYLFRGYNYFHYFDLSFHFTFLFFLGSLFFLMSYFYYQTGFSHSESGKQSLFSILTYSFIYRALYVVPLILALYKLAKGDLRWYTK